MFQAAFDAVTAANVDIKVDPDIVAGESKCFGHLIGKLGHLNGGPDIQDGGGVVPFTNHSEGLNGHGGVSCPVNAVAQLVFTAFEVFLNRAPDKLSVKDDIGAVLGVNQGRACQKGFFWVDDVLEHFVLNVHQLCRILGQCAGLGHNSPQWPRDSE